MSISKYLPWILSLITLRQTQQTTITPYRTKNIFVGVLILFIISLSFLQLSNVFHNWLAQFENGVLIEVSVFSTLIVLGFIILVVIFKRPSITPNVPMNQEVVSLNLPTVATHFTNGFKEGFQNFNANNNELL